MARADGRVEPGQSLKSAFSARAWNRAQDAADIVLGERTVFGADAAAYRSAPYTWVYGRTTSAVSRWAVVAITGVAVTPTSTDTAAATVQFQAMPIVTLGTPSGSSTAFGVAIEPIGRDKIGKVAVAGAVQVRRDDLHKLTDKRVLWEDDNWALVVLQGASIRLGTINGTWTKNQTATVTMQSGDGAAVSPTVTFTATNYFATVTVASGTRRVACARIDNTWVLIAAECA
jgi:hypothetical protein